MWQLTLDAALLGAHIQKQTQGFRPRDVKFMMELSWNWQASIANLKSQEVVHNNQLKRALHELVSDAWANQIKKETVSYRLTRAGIIGLLQRIKDRGLNESFESYLFAHYILVSYRDRLMQLIDKAGNPMPLGFQTEVKALLNVEQLKRERIAKLEGQYQYLNERILETERTVSFTKEQLAQKATLEQIVARIEKSFPYELNHQKPLTQLFAETPVDLQLWELTDGNQMRIRLLWRNYLSLIQNQLLILKDQKN